MSFSLNISRFGISVSRFVGLAALAVLFVFAAASQGNAQAFSEDFAVVPVPGWFTQNNSVPVGSTGWFQGNSAVFPAHMGAPTSYIGANFNNTGGTATISNWLVTPNRTFSNGDVIRFFTRTTDKNPFPDRLQVRLSTAGTSTNVGQGSAGVGDFTTLLLDINPNYQTGGVYPEIFTQFEITLAGLAGPTSGRIAFRYFVELGGPTGDNSNYIGIDTFSYTPAGATAPAQHVVDFDGDGKTDAAVVRNVGGGAAGQIRWYLTTPAGATLAYDWGLATDFFVPEDYDGDNKTDIAVWRPGAPGSSEFYILQSNGFTVRRDVFGQSGDDPTVVGDYDGDGKADVAVYRSGLAAGLPSTWFYRGSLTPTNITYAPWGQNGDFPAPGDYDGDGKNDFVIQRNSGGGQAAFWHKLSAGGTPVIPFGRAADVIVPGDYDGDGKTDLATVRGNAGGLDWYVRNSSSAAISVRTFGLSTDFTTQGDYDGDGRTDLAVWRSSITPGTSTFWILGSTSGAASVPFGQNGDYPVANYNSH